MVDSSRLKNTRNFVNFLAHLGCNLLLKVLNIKRTSAYAHSSEPVKPLNFIGLNCKRQLFTLRRFFNTNHFMRQIAWISIVEEVLYLTCMRTCYWPYVHLKMKIYNLSHILLTNQFQSHMILRPETLQPHILCHEIVTFNMLCLTVPSAHSR